MKKVILSVVLIIGYLSSHCQIPCGIYGDKMKFKSLKQDVETIKKSMKKISSLKSIHDITRWTINKEKHAQNIQNEMSSYFLSQRVKLKDKNRIKHLKFIHEITVYAMQSKQKVDVKIANKLLDSIQNYESFYNKLHGKKHERNSNSIKK